MNRMIVIASGKGGVGKTTTAINLGAAIRYFKKDVLIIDANMYTPNIGIHLNSPEVPINLNHILQKKAHPHEAVYIHESGIKVIPSSLSVKELKKLKIEKLKAGVFGQCLQCRIIRYAHPQGAGRLAAKNAALAKTQTQGRGLNAR